MPAYKDYSEIASVLSFLLRAREFASTVGGPSGADRAGLNLARPKPFTNELVQIELETILKA